MRSLLGQIGHLSVILAFVTALISACSYTFAALWPDSKDQLSWLKMGRYLFFAHALAILFIIISLFSIIYGHFYEYHYAWSHSSNVLPTHYMISCFWEGQEGSFLLWLFWQAVLGLILIKTQQKWESPVMMIFAIVQAFLASMILGVVFAEVLKIGSSPFILLKEHMPNAPVYQMNPNFIPKDGTGLNPLLQNYWMVIHPPTLFLGFALTLIPFAFAIAGLVHKEYTQWIRPALPWAIIGALILGIGILMGGYWAYETLNFGGYWNWDPVENAVYVPWLTLVAAIHCMIIFRKNATGLKASYILSIFSFLLILYSTFLTRSGILGNASVHSFTDLGLSGQLLVYLLFFVAMAIYLLMLRWKQLPKPHQELGWTQREFWILLGVLTLCLSAFQIIFTTSIPVYNAIAKGLNIDTNMALPADQMAHYSKIQIWFAIALGLLSGTGQYFYWQKVDPKKILSQLSTPFMVALLLSTLMFTLTKIQSPSYILLLVAGLYTLIANAWILVRMMQQSPKLAGGSIAHMGLGLMLIGILYSSGYSKVVSKNSTGLLYSKEFTNEMNADNILLWRDTPFQMGAYEVLYKGPRIELQKYSGYVHQENIKYIAETESGAEHKALVQRPFALGSHSFKKGDTVDVVRENTFYELSFRQENDTFTLFPRAQINPQMGGLLASPDVKKMFGRDLYTHVSSIPDPKEEKKWSVMEEKKINIGDTFLLNDYYAKLKSVERVQEVEGIPLETGDLAVKAVVEVYGRNQTYILEPIFLVRDQMVGRVPVVEGAIGVELSLLLVDPTTGAFTFGIRTSQKDWIILKAMEKPLIDLLWLGALMVSFGFGWAAWRRYQEYTWESKHAS